MLPQCARWVITGLLSLVIGALALPSRADTFTFGTADHSLYTRLMTSAISAKSCFGGSIIWMAQRPARAGSQACARAT